MPRSLADGRTKVALLLTRPADESKPTVDELNAGMDISCNLLDSDFRFSATASEQITDEKPLCVEGNSTTLGPSNYEATLSLFRYFDANGAVDFEDDAAFQALKTKGTECWIYARKTSKKSGDPWEAGDEIYLGARGATDTPQDHTNRTGYIKVTIPYAVEEGFPFIEVADDTPGEVGDQGGLVGVP